MLDMKTFFFLFSFVKVGQCVLPPSGVVQPVYKIFCTWRTWSDRKQQLEKNNKNKSLRWSLMPFLKIPARIGIHMKCIGASVWISCMNLRDFYYFFKTDVLPDKICCSTCSDLMWLKCVAWGHNKKICIQGLFSWVNP